MNKASYFFLAVFFFVADQISKWAVLEHMIRPALNEKSGGRYDPPSSLVEWLKDAPALLPPESITVLPFFNIVMVWNKGVSFGLFSQGSDYGPYILSAVAALIIIAFVIWLVRSASHLQSFSIALVIGGALGNIMDRFRFGAVADFIDIHAFGYHWPAFNISDSCICVGVFLLIIHSFFFEKGEKDATYDKHTKTGSA